MEGKGRELIVKDEVKSIEGTDTICSNGLFFSF